MFVNFLANRTLVRHVLAGTVCALFLGIAGPRPAWSAPVTLVIDDFEGGAGAWTRNDMGKSDNGAGDVTLVNVASAPAAPGGVPGSHSAGLFTFKTAQNSWASASHSIDGTKWAQIGAQRLTFWLNANGEKTGVDLVLRGHYKVGGQGRDEAFHLPAPILLESTHWRKVAIPLSDFKSPNGALPGRLSGVYLLQFVQSGSWDSRFFSVDQLQVEGNGQPIPQKPLDVAAPAATPAPTAAANAASVSVDYLRVLGRIRPAANVSLGGAQTTAGGEINFPLETNARFRSALQTLRPRFVRLQAGALVDLTDSSRPDFDFSRLIVAARRARALGSEPLIALDNPSAWSLDARGYAALAAGVARALNAPNGPQARYYELALGQMPPGESGLGDTAMIAFYNRARLALKKASSTYRVGGLGASAGRMGLVNAFLRGATGVDFLAVQFFGVHAPASDKTASDAALFAAARDVPSLRLAAEALDRSRWKDAPLYVTGSNLNDARAEGENAPADARIVQMPAAAWWLSYLASASTVADQVFFNDAINPEWGLLDDKVQAYPAYYALWMWNSFAPPGSERVQSKSSQPGLVALATNTAASHNLLLANTTGGDITARVAIRGFPVLRAAFLHLLEDPASGVQGGTAGQLLAKSPFQTITLKPYAVAVLRFTEPPQR